MSVITPLTPNQLGGIKKAVKADKMANTAQAIELVGQVGSAIISTVYSIKNEKLRQQYADELQKLNEKQAAELEQMLKSIQSVDDRIAQFGAILGQVLAKQSSDTITQGINKAYLSETKSQLKLILSAFGVFIAIIGTVALIKKIRK